jgi:hypothetical protein
LLGETDNCGLLMRDSEACLPSADGWKIAEMKNSVTFSGSEANEIIVPTEERTRNKREVKFLNNIVSESRCLGEIRSLVRVVA